MKLSKEIKEIINWFKISISFLHKKEKITLALSTIIMLWVGMLTNLPAVILWGFVDEIINIKNPDFNIAVPFIWLILIIIIIKEILKESWTTLENVVKVVIYVKNISDFSKISKIRNKYLASSKPVSTLVEISNTVREWCDIEIDVIAVK
jgi:2-iminobutanoate/2-iminopropanoate deaminase